METGGFRSNESLDRPCPRVVSYEHCLSALQVPIALYFMTHAYFCFYHTLANVCLRRVSRAVAPGAPRLLALGAVVFCLSYATAFMETLTISHFPYYNFRVSSAVSHVLAGVCELFVIVCSSRGSRILLQWH